MEKNNQFIAEAIETLRNRQPSKEFLEKHTYVFSLQEKSSNSDHIELYTSSSRNIYIHKNDLGKLQGFTESLKNSKTKAEEKAERKINKSKKMILKNKHIYDNVAKENENYFRIFSGKFNTIEKNKRFIFDILQSKMSEQVLDRVENFISLDEMKNEYDQFFKQHIPIKFINYAAGLDLLLSEIEGLNDYKVFNSSYYQNLIVLHISQKILKKKTYINTKASINIHDQELYAKIKVNYDDKFLKNSDFSIVSVLKDLKELNFINNLIITESDIDAYIRTRFERTVEDISLLKEDKLLKESFYPDFFSKLNNVKRKSAKTSISLKNNDWNKNDVKEKIIQSLLTQFFDVKEKRINGFKRSINRRIIQKKLEIDNFKDLFPFARERKRKITYIQGETNSGKTYTAFEMAKSKQSGIYAAPLRLLALEGQQEFEKRGVPCSMITGEEKDEVLGANFTSSTVEMINYTEAYDVAIIDEVQLINDPDRGHAWLEAIIGVNAKDVILVGSKDIEPVIKELADYLVEELEIQTFHRKTKLQFDKDLFNNSINELGKLPPHSAVIAFSKKDVLDLKSKFEYMGNVVSIIYGALPPQVRRIETERFVNGEADVIIGTDAIGMGLNLPIENLFFYKKEKFDGRSIVPIEPALVKQIVGRAGRFNKFDVGYVSALSDDVFDYISTTFHKDTLVTEKELKCSPNYAIINQVYELTNDSSIYKLLQNYNNAINFDFEIKNHMNEHAYLIARCIDDFSKDRIKQLSLFEKVKLVNAPLSMDRGYKMLDFYKRCINDIYTLREDPDTHPISVVYERLDRIPTGTQAQTELSIKKIDILSWLSFNFEEFSCLESMITDKRKELNKKLVGFLRN